MSFTILTTNLKGVDSDWNKFLNDKAIDCPITFEEAKVGEVGTGAGDTKAGFVATPTRFSGLKFTSATNIIRFNFEGHFPSSDKADVKEDVILLGLEQGVQQPQSLGKVLEAFTGKPEAPGSGIASKILTSLINTLTDKVAMTVVNGPTTRNGIWCVAGQTRVISTALVFALDPETALVDIKQMIQDELAIDIGGLGPLTFHFQRTSYGTRKLDDDGQLQWAVTDAWAMTIQVTIGGFDFWLQEDSGDTSVILTQNETDPTDVWTNLSRLGQQAPPPVPGTDKIPAPPNTPPPTSESKPSGPDITGRIDLLSVSSGRNLAQTRWWEVKTVLPWEVRDNKTPVMIGLSYSSLQHSFVGELLTRDSFPSDKTLMTYRPSADVAPRGVGVLPDVIFLSDLFPQAEKLPDAIPNAISVARVTYSSDGEKTKSNFGLEATLVRHDVQRTTTSTTAVPCPFSWDSVSFYARRVTTATAPAQPGGKAVKVSTYSFGATATFALHPREQEKDIYNSAVLTLSLDYDEEEWRVEGHVQDLNFGALAGLMDPNDGVGDAALDILGKLSLTELNVVFTYKAKRPSSFLATGVITFGALELRLFYQYVGAEALKGKTAADLPGKRKAGDPESLEPPKKKGDPAVWMMRAYLGAAGGKKATIGEIIDSISGKAEGSDEIPEFIKSIEIAPADTNAGSAVSFEVTKNNQGAVVFILSVNVVGIKFTYMQISSKPAAVAGDSLPSGSKPPTAPRTTRLLRIAIDKLPLIDGIPLVSQLGQPFDKMLYLYVSGDKGLLEHELDAINEAVTSDENKLVFKRAVAKPSLKNPVIGKGHHFMIIQSGDVILDHVFEIGDDEKKKPAIESSDKNDDKIKTLALRSAAAPVTPTKAPTNTPTKGSISKSMGPLTISALTLEYKSKTLFIYMDATLTLGPMSLGLLGFGIGFLTTGLQLNNLSKLVTEADKRLSVSLRGMSLAFDRPPVLIAGMFEHDIVQLAGRSVAESYRGGVGIGFPPYTFIGVGEYSDVKKFNTDGTSAGSYKSVFLFAKLDGPLVTLEFATISGVRMGFGFNSILRSPMIDDLTEFPFIKSSSADGAARNPMAILKSMTPGWVTPREGSYWLAAGMTVLSFDIIAITAVAMFAFRDSGVIISIFADAVAQLPPHVPEPAGVILYVEIGMVAEMNLIDGYFRVEASLAPSSYLLVPQCHITGGFALAYWFGNNLNAGDWVFSVGGYHRAFKPPPYYPVPSRLAISFVIGDNIQMRGESYFAITPKAAMAGALLHISLSVGPVSANLDASFDALINFHPFHYIVEFSVSIGVECNIDIWFIHIHISVHIGAELHIEGPEFGGIAHVDFWFFGFDIEFGARIGRPPLLELLEFWKTTHQPGPGTSDRQDTDTNPVQSQLIYDDNFTATPPIPKPLTPTTVSKPLTHTFVPNAAFKFILEDGNFPMPSSPDPASTSNSVPSTGAGAKWFVKGGTFRFGITTEFAISSVKIAGTTDAPNRPIFNPQGGQDNGQLQYQKVYSNPMHVTKPINSALTITIRRIRPPLTQADGVVANWLDIKPNVKNVPVAMWDKYNPSLDIMALGPQVGPPPSLLDGSSKATIPQTLGVSLSAPFPVIAEAKIPKFKASAMARLGVKNLVLVKEPVVDENTGKPVVDPVTGAVKTVDVVRGFDWFIPDFEPVQARFMGAKLTGDEKGMDAIARWDGLGKQWTRAAQGGKEVVGNEDEKGKGDIDGLLGMVSGVFGWSEDGNRPVGEVVEEDERKPWMLSGRMPKKLVTGLEDFYLDLPRVCV